MSAGAAERRLRALVLGVGVLSLVATVAALLYGGRFSPPRAHEPDSYGKSAISHRALVETLEALGVRVVRFRSGRYGDVEAPLWFIEPDPTSADLGNQKYDLARIISKRTREGRATVVVLGKWRNNGDGTVSAVPRKAITDVLHAVLPDAALRVEVEDDDAARHAVLRGPLGPVHIDVPSLQSLRPDPHLQPLASAGDRIVVARVAGTHVLLVSDPDLFHNFNIQRADHAELAERIIRRELKSDIIVVDEVFHGHGRIPSLAAALGRFPAVLLPIHALLLVLFIAIAGFVRFGPSLPLRGTRRLGPAEAIEVGGSVLAMGQPPRLLVLSYIEHVLDDLAQKHGISETDRKLRADRIDEIAQRKGVAPQATRLLSEVKQLESNHTASGRALALAKAASAFHRRLTSRPSAAAHRKAA